MATYGPHGLVIPEYPNAADGPAAFQQFAQSVEKGLYGTATDEADRDTRYADIPVGGLVSCPNLLALWQRTATGWHTVTEDTGPVTTGFTAAAGWDLGVCETVRRDGRADVYMEVFRTGGAINASAGGNIPDTTIGTIPAGFTPWRDRYPAYRAFVTSGMCRIFANGTVTLLDAHANSTIGTDQSVVVTDTYRVSGV